MRKHKYIFIELSKTLILFLIEFNATKYFLTVFNEAIVN